MYLVAHTSRVDSRQSRDVDHWYAFETLQEAETAYQELVLHEATHSASICKVIKSTDFTCEPTPPPGYTAEELDRDNPYNQWMHT